MSNQNFRPQVKGKFIFIGNEKLYIRGVTYGTFRPNCQGELYPNLEQVAQDFAQMAAHGINSIRTYTVPPKWLLDLADEQDLKVMVGLPWEQHIAFLDDPQRIKKIEYRLRAAVQACDQHPAILCYAIGNEIPAPMVRWYGSRPVEKFLKRLYRAVKREDPEALVTYVNYPSTEYLQLPFIDFVCFNVYLESEDKLKAYIARLQNLAGNRPLVMAEIGLDSLRNGEAHQAQVLDWQIRTIFEAACAGCFVFAWTDEWYRGGFEIEDWDFGLTNRQRHSKPSLSAVSQAFADVPFPADLSWPSISVAVCSYNGAATIGETLAVLEQLDYPDYEVIVVDDGSTNGVAAIAQQYDVRLIVHSHNQGLSAARNTALKAATGEIIAYIDDDAYPDPHWLNYLAVTFLNGNWVGVGGPNIPPPGDGWIADCVANAPGGPIHVLLCDREAEHIPGCNMAYWKSCLQDIGGFDSQFRAAGDDVDICWQLQQQGWKIGFSPAAVVWHHRRNSINAYWKQQQGYGKAEALLEQKWPDKYNAVGHLNWSGRLYGQGLVKMLGLSPTRIYHGRWGSALFQSIDQPAPSLLSSLSVMPEWYIILLILAGLASLGGIWQPMLWFILPLAAGITVSVIQAVWSATHASFTTQPQSFLTRIQLYSLTTILYLIQPLARLWGRFSFGLTPWRRRGTNGFKLPRTRQICLWSESWQSADHWLEKLEGQLRQQGAIPLHGGDFERWDLEVRGGLWGRYRLLMTLEEHGDGKQLIRFRSWPKVTSAGWILMGLLLLLLGAATLAQGGIIFAILGLLDLIFLWVIFQDCAVATAAYVRAVEQIETEISALLKNNTNQSDQTVNLAIEPVKVEK